MDSERSGELELPAEAMTTTKGTKAAADDGGRAAGGRGEKVADRRMRGGRLSVRRAFCYMMS